MKILILAVFVAFCDAGAITLPETASDGGLIENSSDSCSEEGAPHLWSRDEYMRDFELAIKYMKRGYMRALNVDGAPRRMKRDRDEDLTRCGDVAGATAGFLGALSVLIPNPITPIAAAASGVAAGSCVLGKYTPEDFEDDRWDQFSILSGS